MAATLMPSAADDSRKNAAKWRNRRDNHQQQQQQSVITLVPTTTTAATTATTTRNRPSVHCIITPLIFFTLVSMATAEPSWKEAPQDKSVPLATPSVTLSCGVNDLPEDSAIIWTLYEDNGSGSTTLFINDGYVGSPSWPEKSRYTVIPHPTRNNGLGYDLVISSISRYDDRMFECQVGGSELRGKATITVLVKPGDPILSTNQSAADVSENDFLLVTCSTAGGNPTPEIAIRKNGAVIPTETQAPADKFGTTVAAAVLALAYEDDGAVIRCDVNNDAGPADNEGEMTLDVRYGPKITFLHDNPLNILVGENIVLECSVRANPAVSESNVIWRHNGTEIGTGFQYVITVATQTDAGQYSCAATNTIATAEEDLVLDVQYGPKLTLWSNPPASDDRIDITETESFNLTCVIHSNPPADKVEWRRNSVIVAFGPVYTVSSVQRSDDGTYECIAENVVSPSGRPSEKVTESLSVVVKVKYRPGPASITLPDSAIKGENAVLTCAVDDPGYPEASLVWTVLGSGTEIGTGARLLFTPVLLEDTDDYVCTPGNEIGAGQAATEELVVLERPERIAPVLPTEKIVDITDSATTSSCAARGKPSPLIVWKKNGDVIDVTDGYFTIEEEKKAIDVHSWNVTSQLLWKGPKRSPNTDSLTPLDSGDFTCHVTNDISTTPITDAMTFIVRYPPVLNTTSKKVAIDTNESAIFVCGSHSVPSATFRWFNGSTELVHDGRIHISTSTPSPGEFYVESVMEIGDVTGFDLGNYSCLAVNDLGERRTFIELTVKTVPESPHNLHILDRTWESVELSWNAGFDGGYQQTFTILYQSPDASSGSIEAGERSRYNVTDLFPSANYTFWVYAENFLGTGGYSKPSVAYTDEFAIDEPSSVIYDPSTRTLTFESPSTNYCARVEIRADGTSEGAGDWDLYEPCAPTAGGSVKIGHEVEVEDVRVALCLDRRNEICSEHVDAFIEDTDDLPTSTIIIVAVVCGTVVVALTIVLIILCCRRHKQLKYVEEQTKRTAPPASGDVKQVNPRGFDNPAVDGRDNIDFDDASAGGVFATNVSAAHNGGNNYDPYLQRQPSNRPSNGYAPHSNGYHHSPRGKQDMMPPAYDDCAPPPPARQPIYSHDNPYGAINKKKADAIYLDEPYPTTELHKDGSSGDSGVSTPDPNIKPKKIIHEVIV